MREPAAPLVVIQRGCELALFQPRKIGNLDCTFCLDCVQACPYDNVGIISRVPADGIDCAIRCDPASGSFRSARISRRSTIVFTFRRFAERVWNGESGLRARAVARKVVWCSL